MRTCTQEEESALLGIQAFCLPSHYTEEMEKYVYSIWAFMNLQDLSGRH